MARGWRETRLQSRRSHVAGEVLLGRAGVVAGRVTGSIDHPAFMAYGELITGWQEQRSRRGPVPLRAGGGMVEALDQVTLLKMMPTLAGPQHDEREPLIIKVQTAAPGVISSLP
jgi:hypothetical protein